MTDAFFEFIDWNNANTIFYKQFLTFDSKTHVSFKIAPQFKTFGHSCS